MAYFDFGQHGSNRKLPQAKRTVKDDVRMRLKSGQNSSNRQRRKNGHAQPSLPKIIFPELSDEDGE